MSIEQRIARLERQNRRLRVTVGAMLAVGAAGLLMGAAREAASAEVPAVIRAHRFEVVTEQGKPAIILAMTNRESGTIATLDAKGNKLVNLGVTTNGEGTVTMQNNRGKDIVRLAATTAGEGVILTQNGDGDKLLELGVTTDGEPKVYAYKADGQVRASWP